MKAKKILIVSCDNDQELADITEIVRALRKESNFIAIYFEGRRHGLKKVPHDVFDEVISKKRAWLYLFQLRLKYKTVWLLSGVAVARLRTISWFFRIKHASYIRTKVLLDHRAEKIKKLLDKLIIPKRFAFLYPYYANKIYVIDERTKEYIAEITHRTAKIEAVASLSRIIYLDARRNRKPISKESIRLVFITTGYAWHGYHDAAREELELVKYLASKFRDKLIVRVHPRDDWRRYLGVVSAERIDKEESFIFHQYEGDYFITTTSTLPAEYEEIWVGGIYVAGPVIIDKFEKWYKKNKITPANIESVALHYQKSLGSRRQKTASQPRNKLESISSAQVFF
jgi:hypothetical protein